MRALHHWGASLMIVIVVLHMIQTFLWGSYKKPREATWIAGVLLLLLTLAFGLSGYLLPWDNRAYWGTVVTTQISALAPGAGPLLSACSAATARPSGLSPSPASTWPTSRCSPPLTVLLIAMHLISGAAARSRSRSLRRATAQEKVLSRTSGQRRRRHLRVVRRADGHGGAWRVVPLGHLADPTDLSYIPRPEWYFLFLFQFLKWFEGPFEVVGAVILPTLAIVALLLIPFIDRGKMKMVRQRTGAIGLVAAGRHLLGRTHRSAP